MSDRGKKGGGAALMAQMGWSDMADMEKDIYGDLEEDEELEAELARLQGKDVPQRKKGGNITGLDAMVTESMKDVGDDEISDVDEDDEDLLNELQGLSEDSGEPQAKRAPTETTTNDQSKLIEERLSMYHEAHQSAKASGDTSKAKRLDRGIKTLNDMLKKARSGKTVDEDDIPPAVHTSPVKHAVSPVSPVKTVSPPVSEVVTPDIPASQPAPPAVSPKEIVQRKNGDETQTLLKTRRDQYRHAALLAKKSNDIATASKYLKIAKQFEAVMQAAERGDPIDLSQMPAPPGQAGPPSAPVVRESAQASANVAAEEELDLPVTSSEEKKKIYNAPTEAGSVMEALQQRLEKYKSSSEQAKEEGNGSKARRMGRIVKQYEDAIKSHKARKPVNYEELPTPPGFPPIPVPKQALSSPSPAKAASPVKPAAGATSPVSSTGKLTPQRTAPGKPDAKRSPSRAEQQAMFLEERQMQFKRAALEAKKKGDMALARKYLKTSKGFEQMIEASHSGLPVDLSKLPALPGMKPIDLSKSPIPAASEDQSDADPEAPTGNRKDMYKKLEQELITQIRTCTTNGDHFTQLGDVSTANKFDKMGQNSRKDLDALRNAFKHEDPVPRFHYETKEFSIVQSCTDLGDNDLEIEIVRGINYHIPSGYSPKDMDTYVKYEFPYPNDSPQSGCSDTCKHTNNPEYDQTFKLQITRKSRAFLRLLKSSKTVRFDVYYKRGLFKGDKLLGSVTLKLAGLETQCVVHESYDLMDGRKSVGGKLEVKIKVRHPFVTQQVEEIKERWLIIDKFERKLDPMPSSTKPSGRSKPQTDFQSMEVMKYEKQLLDKQIEKLQGKLTESQFQALKVRSNSLAENIESTKGRLKSGGMSALQEYLAAIEKSPSVFLQEAQSLSREGQREKAQLNMNKKMVVEREIETIRTRIPPS